MGWGNIVPFPRTGMGYNPHNSQKTRMRHVQPVRSAILNERRDRQGPLTCVYPCRLAFSFANGKKIVQAMRVLAYLLVGINLSFCYPVFYTVRPQITFTPLPPRGGYIGMSTYSNCCCNAYIDYIITVVK